MSQFLICKSKNDLSKYGIPFSSCKLNKNLYEEAINYYFKGLTENIWIIEKMCNWIYELNKNMDKVVEISEKSDIAVFWYGSEYNDLENIYSIEELIDYIGQEINNPCIELYIFFKNI